MFKPTEHESLMIILHDNTASTFSSCMSQRENLSFHDYFLRCKWWSCTWQETCHFLQQKTDCFLNQTLCTREVIDYLTVTDLGFSRSGVANSKSGGEKLLFGQFPPKNCMKLKEFGPREDDCWGASGARFRSANVWRGEYHGQYPSVCTDHTACRKTFSLKNYIEKAR